MYSKLLSIIVIIFISYTALSAPTYGAEFELISDAIKKATLQTGDDEYARGANVVIKNELERLKYSLDLACNHPCFSRGYSFFPNEKFSFNLFSDYGTIEINTTAATLDELKRYESDIDRSLFIPAFRAGFYADKFDGAGHFNIGLKSAFFEGRSEAEAVELMLRYFFDFSSHTELALGVWMKDESNAPAINQHGSIITEHLKELAIYFQDPENHSLVKFQNKFGQLKRLRSNQGQVPFNFYKYTALRLPTDEDSFENRLPKKTVTLEIRSMLPQSKMEQFILAAEIFELRLAYLETQMKMGIPLKFFETDPDMSEKEKANRYYLYITEMGGDWNRFGKLVHPNLKNTTNPVAF